MNQVLAPLKERDEWTVVVAIVLYSQELKYKNVLTTELERSLKNKKWSNQTESVGVTTEFPLSLDQSALTVQ